MVTGVEVICGAWVPVGGSGSFLTLFVIAEVVPALLVGGTPVGAVFTGCTVCAAVRDGPEGSTVFADVACAVALDFTFSSSAVSLSTCS